MIYSHKGRWASRVTIAGLGGSREQEGLSFHAMKRGNWICVCVCGGGGGGGGGGGYVVLSYTPNCHDFKNKWNLYHFFAVVILNIHKYTIVTQWY